jgi:sugar-specific transcriptional regulator TrmB
VLEVLGLDKDAEHLYRLMLAHPQDGVAELSRRLSMPPTHIRRGLDRLSALALIQPATREGTGFRAIPPEAAMEVLLARQQADLAAQQLRVEASRAAAARLIAECSALRPQTVDTFSEQLTGPEEIRARLGRLAAEVQREIMTFAPGGAHTEADLQASREPNAELLDRGVAVRTIYLDSVRNHSLTMEHLAWLGLRGGQVRTLSR